MLYNDYTYKVLNNMRKAVNVNDLNVRLNLLYLECK